MKSFGILGEKEAVLRIGFEKQGKHGKPATNAIIAQTAIGNLLLVILKNLALKHLKLQVLVYAD